MEGRGRSDEIGAFLSKSKPHERDQGGDRCKYANEVKREMFYEDLLPVRNVLLPHYSF